MTLLRGLAWWLADRLDRLAWLLRRRAGLEQPAVRVETRTLEQLDEWADEWADDGVDELTARRAAQQLRPAEEWDEPL